MTQKFYQFYSMLLDRNRSATMQSRIRVSICRSFLWSILNFWTIPVLKPLLPNCLTHKDWFSILFFHIANHIGISFASLRLPELSYGLYWISFVTIHLTLQYVYDMFNFSPIFRKNVSENLSTWVTVSKIRMERR